ncbi:hypothetical protein ElyMa_005093100 [Elysia marginata]|uniref:Uncharacterized protein n=1 Tax=Elysia marginata TaxID=1093978 RepID=A0AAV4JK94_9GAST|nr:hypothetical protein ElyMa_005093100 [Elysia marginata]
MLVGGSSSDDEKEEEKGEVNDDDDDYHDDYGVAGGSGDGTGCRGWSRASQTETDGAVAVWGYSATVLQSYRATELKSCGATALQCYRATELQSYRATELHELQGYGMRNEAETEGSWIIHVQVPWGNSRGVQ